MVTWRRKLNRSAATALLLLFAMRAVAGTALCELYGEHGAPPGTAQAISAQDRSAPAQHRAAPHEHGSSGEAPAKDRGDHACEEPTYLIDGTGAVAVKKLSFAVGDAAACTYAPATWLRPVPIAALTRPHCLERPPPSRAPLDIAPRLRI
ncbi:MAG: hypothetical protein KIT60_20250 [Burkholderiaceae bacterium]|nr:hypothetical protein [Burkholderiaceae bacterium]